MLSAAFALVALSANVSAAREELCDPSFQDCRDAADRPHERRDTEIDVGLWFMDDARYSNLLVSRAQAGVQVRVLMDPREFAQDSVDETDHEPARQAAGIPMRKRIASGIEHWKTMLFAGQNTVEFGSANYSADAFVPVTPYMNYVGRDGLLHDDASVIVNSFKTKFDDALDRHDQLRDLRERHRSARAHYPTYPIDPDLNFPPGAGLTRTAPLSATTPRRRRSTWTCSASPTSGTPTR